MSDLIDFQSIDFMDFNEYNKYLNDIPFESFINPNNLNNNLNQSLTQYSTQCQNNNSINRIPDNRFQAFNGFNYNNNYNLLNNNNHYVNYEQNNNNSFGISNAFNNNQNLNHFQNYGNNYRIDNNNELICDQNSLQMDQFLMSKTINGELISSQEFIEQNYTSLQSTQIEEKVSENQIPFTPTLNQMNDKTQQIVIQINGSLKVVNEVSNDDKKEKKDKEREMDGKQVLKLSKIESRGKQLRFRPIDRKTIETRLRLKRERNRIAAKKCRDKKLQMIKTLENRKFVLTQETIQMENELMKRRKEIIDMKMCFLRHKFNNCKLINKK